MMPSMESGAGRPEGATQNVDSWPDLGLNTLDTAIVHAVAYADVFDYPLTPEEVHRYAVRAPASLAAVQDALHTSPSLLRYLAFPQGYITLRDREALVESRRRRAAIASSMWPRVERYASTIAALPFVRMVAVSGALSMANTEAATDIDYFIVTEPGRLWLCRAAIIAVVRLAAKAGDEICPNYLLTERALVLREHNLYTAHELLQMVPLIGLQIYRKLLNLNTWAAEFLPNAYERARNLPVHPLQQHPFRRVTEVLLHTRVGTTLEQWEMTRKIDRFSRSAGDGSAAAFGPDWCKGHIVDHSTRARAAFAARLRCLVQT